MPESRLERTRRAYALDFDPGNDLPDGPEPPTARCICGSAWNEPHAPECHRLRACETDDYAYGHGV